MFFALLFLLYVNFSSKCEYVCIKKLEVFHSFEGNQSTKLWGNCKIIRIPYQIYDWSKLPSLNSEILEHGNQQRLLEVFTKSNDSVIDFLLGWEQFQNPQCTNGNILLHYCYLNHILFIFFLPEKYEYFYYLVAACLPERSS